MSLSNKPFIKLSPSDIPRACLPVIATNPHTGLSVKVYGIIDTGADECAFPANFAPILGHDLQKGKPRQINTGNGVTIAYSHAISMNVDGYTIDNVLIDFMPNLAVVLLGVKSFLSNFALKIDYIDQKFSLIHKKKTKR